MKMKSKFFSVFVLKIALFSQIHFVYSQQDVENVNETLSWEAPLELKKLYPYEISGLDRDGAPVCCVRLGHWDIRLTMEKGQPYVHDFEKYAAQMWLRFHYSPQNYGQSGTNEYILILDLSDFSFSQVLHIPTFMELLTMTRQFVEIDRSGPNGKQGYIVNANYVFMMVYEFLRPLIGNLANLVEIYGTNEERWKPVLLKKIPRSQLPEWAGGFPNHRPLKYFGA